MEKMKYIGIILLVVAGVWAVSHRNRNSKGSPKIESDQAIVSEENKQSVDPNSASDPKSEKKASISSGQISESGKDVNISVSTTVGSELRNGQMSQQSVPAAQESTTTSSVPQQVAATDPKYTVSGVHIKKMTAQEYKDELIAKGASADSINRASTQNSYMTFTVDPGVKQVAPFDIDFGNCIYVAKIVSAALVEFNISQVLSAQYINPDVKEPVPEGLFSCHFTLKKPFNGDPNTKMVVLIQPLPKAAH